MQNGNLGTILALATVCGMTGLIGVGGKERWDKGKSILDILRTMGSVKTFLACFL